MSIFKSMLAAFCVALGTYLVYYIYWQLTAGLVRRRLIHHHGCQPAKRVPRNDPILGLDLLLQILARFREHKSLEMVDHYFRRAETGTVDLRILGQSFLLTMDPENLKTILSLDFSSFHLPKGRKEGLQQFLGYGIFTTDGEAWHRSRQLIRPMFERSQIDDPELLEKHVQNLIQAIPTNGSTVDLEDLFLRFTIDLATEFLFGQSTNCLAPGTEKGFDDVKFVNAFNYCANPMSKNAADVGLMSLLLQMLRPTDRKFKHYCKFIHSWIDDFIEQALAHRTVPKHGKRILLDSFTSLDPPAPKEIIRTELLHILVAGRDTTAALLTNVFFTLSRSPDTKRRLRAEIDSTFDAPVTPPSLATIKDVKRMPYLRGCLNESLRLMPVVPINTREAVRDTVLPTGGGPDGNAPLFVPKGALLAWSIYSMHRRKDIYGADALKFVPERWIEDWDEQLQRPAIGHGETVQEKNKGLRPGWGYLPFNGGPRTCIGQQFALTEASYVTVRLLHHFDFESHDPEPWREKLGLTCTSLAGCKVGATSRDKAF